MTLVAILTVRKALALLGVGLWLTLAAFGAASQPADKPPNLADFIENTKRYKGRSFSLSLIVSEEIHGRKGDSLRNYRGHTVPFHGYFGRNQTRFDLKIEIPRNLEVPHAAGLDRLTVGFVCAEGDLQKGNVATSITR